MSLDTIIIGAGLAGLTAARALQDANRSFKVLEARNRVGGKTWSVPLHSGTGVLDMGAAWINPTTQPRIGKLAKEFNLETITQNTHGKVAFLDADGNATAFDYGALPGSSQQEVQDIIAVRDSVQSACVKVDVHDWQAKEELSSLANVSMLDYVRGIAKTQASIRSVEIWTRAMLGLEPEEISALFFLDYCRSGGSLMEMRSDREDGAQYLRFKQGTQQISIHLAAKLRSESIILECPVTSIEQHSNFVVVGCANGSTYRAKKVIITIPSPLYSTIHCSPELSTNKQYVGNSIHGYYTKVILVYDVPWWRELGYCGLSQSFSGGPIAVTRDTSDEHRQWSLTCFVAGQIGREWSLKAHNRRVDEVKDQVAKLFKSDRARDTTEVHVREWHKEEWSQGAPCPAQSPAGDAMEAHKNVRSVEGNLHFAGTETAYFWTGYMDGAVESGDRAAEEVIAALRHHSPTLKATRYRETKL